MYSVVAPLQHIVGHGAAVKSSQHAERQAMHYEHAPPSETGCSHLYMGCS